MNPRRADLHTFNALSDRRLLDRCDCVEVRTAAATHRRSAYFASQACATPLSFELFQLDRISKIERVQPKSFSNSLCEKGPTVVGRPNQRGIFEFAPSVAAPAVAGRGFGDASRRDAMLI
jgi:hypothetical protein